MQPFTERELIDEQRDLGRRMHHAEFVAAHPEYLAPNAERVLADLLEVLSDPPAIVRPMWVEDPGRASKPASAPFVSTITNGRCAVKVTVHAADALSARELVLNAARARFPGQAFSFTVRPA